MSETAGTLAHALLIGDRNIRDAGCSDVLNDAPFLAALRTTTASHGRTHKYLKEDGAPTVGFRAVNTGRDNTNSTDVEVSQDLQYLDPSWDIDVAIANAYPASKGGWDGLMQRESARHVRQSLAVAEKQLFYGVGNDAAGFTGLNVASTLRYKDSEMVLDATGSTVGATTSVWMVRTDDSERECMFVLGEGGNITVPDEATVIQKLDDDGKPYYAYAVPMGGWFGMQIGSKYSVGRICNLTTQAGKGLTDALLFSLFEKFPETRPPNLIVMSKQSRGQLQRSRTATNATGAPAPLPLDWEGIPIITTGSIINTEAVVTATP